MVRDCVALRQPLACPSLAERQTRGFNVANFSPEVADSLLELLSTDDKFRELFEKNPRAALRQVGHVTPEDERDVKGSDPVVCAYGMKGLASKEDIAKARDALHAELTASALRFDVFNSAVS